MNFSRSLLVFLLICATTAQAQLFKRDPGDELEQPDEESLQLPSYPTEANLVPFDPGFVSSFTYYIDTSSLKVGETDRVVRYALVVKSNSGATNVTYEGLRCDTAEKKVWAYGDGKNGWSKARDPQWKPFEKEIYRRTLYDYFFCPRTILVGSVREAIDALKKGGHPHAPYTQSSDQH
ncbi:MAG TPA: CNP1-like family protein [Burkholderiales bacterium]|nr:CNP1-like family protein [Burkholderiales bacterium]